MALLRAAFSKVREPRSRHRERCLRSWQFVLRRLEKAFCLGTLLASTSQIFFDRGNLKVLPIDGGHELLDRRDKSRR